MNVDRAPLRCGPLDSARRIVVPDPNMGAQEKVIPQKPGRPAHGKGTRVQVRLQPDLLEMVDAYARQMEWPVRPTMMQYMSRPEAIRRIWLSISPRNSGSRSGGRNSRAAPQDRGSTMRSPGKAEWQPPGPRSRRRSRSYRDQCGHGRRRDRLSRCPIRAADLLGTRAGKPRLLPLWR